jgi:predicted transcriptional regulator
MRNVMSAQIEDVKKTAHSLIEQLPDGVSWEKLLYTLQVRQDIEAGLEDIKAGRVYSSKEIMTEFNLNKD